MQYFKTKGFPTRVTDKIELPPIEELLLMPFINTVEADIVYKKGTDFQRFLIDKTPITNKKKYVYIQSQVSLQTPKISPVINDFKLDKEWHVDGQDNFIYDDNIFHLLVNKTTSMIEFNCAEIEGYFENSLDLIRQANDENSELSKKIIPKEIEPYRIYTFNNTDIHRARREAKPEFRFIFRVIETDVEMNDGVSVFGESYVYHGSTEPLENIMQYFKDGKVTKLVITKYWE